MINKIGSVSNNKNYNNSSQKNINIHATKNINFGTNIDELKPFVTKYYKFLNKKFIKRLEVLGKDGKERILSLKLDRSPAHPDDSHKSRHEYTLTLKNAKISKVLHKQVLIKQDRTEADAPPEGISYLAKRIQYYIKSKRLDKIESKITKELEVQKKY